MAARKQLFHPDEVRRKIQTSQLLNRLHSHAFGEVDLTAQQVRSIEILLRKVLPDVSTVTLRGDESGGPIVTRVELVAGSPDDDSKNPASA